MDTFDDPWLSKFVAKTEAKLPATSIESATDPLGNIPNITMANWSAWHGVREWGFVSFYGLQEKHGNHEPAGAYSYRRHMWRKVEFGILRLQDHELQIFGCKTGETGFFLDGECIGNVQYCWKFLRKRNVQVLCEGEPFCSINAGWRGVASRQRRDSVANCTLYDGTSFDIVLISRSRFGSAAEGVRALVSSGKQILSSGTSGIISDMSWLSSRTPVFSEAAEKVLMEMPIEKRFLLWGLAAWLTCRKCT